MSEQEWNALGRQLDTARADLLQQCSPEAVRGAIVLACFFDVVRYEELNVGLATLLERMGALAATIVADDRARPDLKSKARSILRIAHPDAVPPGSAAVN